MDEIIQSVAGWLQGIQEKYSVNPYIFAVIYILTVAPFWFSLYKIIDSLRKKIMDKVIFWALLLAFFTIAPFLYIAVFGRNLPWWFWFVLAGAVGLSAVSVIRKIMKRTV